MAAHLHGRPGAPELQAGRNEQDRGPAHARARQAAGGGARGARRPAPLPVGARAALARCGWRSTAGRAPSSCGWASASCCARPSAPASAASTPRSSCRTSRSCSTPSPGGRGRGRRLPAGARRGAGGRGRRPIRRCSARYLEAWLLRLHGLYPPLDRCAACARALPAGRAPLPRAPPTASSATPAGPPRARCCRPRRAASCCELVFAKPPETLAGDRAPADARPLEAFHRDLIAAHLERDLRSPARDPRDRAREGAR